MFEVANVDYTHYIRTTERRHISTVQNFWVSTFTFNFCIYHEMGWPDIKQGVLIVGTCDNHMTCLYIHPRECCVMVIIFIRGSMKAGTRFQTRLSCLIPRSKMEWNQAQRCVPVCVCVCESASADLLSVQVSMESGHIVEWTREDNFMFRLTSFRDRLLEWVETKPYRKYICSSKCLSF